LATAAQILAVHAARRGYLAPMYVAVLLILVAAGYRLLSVYNVELANFSPLMALAFCGAVYLRPRGWWAVPFGALVLSDLWINQAYMADYGYGYGSVQMTVRALCFAAAIGIGAMVARRKSWLNLFSGALGGAVLFYLATNTASWAGDAFYAKTLAGWWQALTVGHPQFPPTLYFFRNSLASDLLFTGVFAVAMEARARHAGQPSLLAAGRV
jgi:hypothetical protein